MREGFTFERQLTAKEAYFAAKANMRREESRQLIEE